MAVQRADSAAQSQLAGLVRIRHYDVSRHEPDGALIGRRGRALNRDAAIVEADTAIERGWLHGRMELYIEPASGASRPRAAVVRTPGNPAKAPAMVNTAAWLAAKRPSVSSTWVVTNTGILAPTANCAAEVTNAWKRLI